MDNGQLHILAIAFGLGLLVGLQREKADSTVAGIRTFPLITVCGVINALLAQSFGGWVLAAGFIAITIMLVSASIIKQSHRYAPGLTTETAALLMYGVGAYLVIGDTTLAIIIGAMVAVLLQLKEVLHNFVQKMGEHDLIAIMRFVAIALIILPILPDKTYGPFQVLNPYDIWRMVVLIVGISLCGYAAYKIFKERAGTILAGILGGLISSTATTVSYARSTKNAPEASSLAALAIMLASTVSVIRVAFAFTVVSPRAISVVLPPLLSLFGVMACLSLVLYFQRQGENQSMPEQENPTELGSAMIFGGLYGAIIFAVAAARELLGTNSLYLIAMISGLTDVDAITLSTGRLLAEQRIEPHIGWQLVLIAILANLVFKMGVVYFLGNKILARKLVWTFASTCLFGLGLLLFWP